LPISALFLTIVTVVLVYQTAPLQSALTLRGPVATRIWIQCNQPTVSLIARLVLVSPDGVAMLLAEGACCVTAVPVAGTTAGLPFQQSACEVDLGCVAVRLEAGWRIRVSVSAALFPRFALGEATALAVLHDIEHPSVLLLPVVVFKDE
jgi:predicted acyl esterase